MWPDKKHKIARRCGGKRVSKSKCKKLEVSATFGSWKFQKWHATMARSTFPSQNAKKLRGSDTFGSWKFQKFHAAVARSAFPSRNVKRPICSDHFWKSGV